MVHDSEIGTKKMLKRGMTQERILHECAPGQNEIDRRILFEFTGVKLDDRDFEGETSFEEDTMVYMDSADGRNFSERLVAPSGTSAGSDTTPLLNPAAS